MILAGLLATGWYLLRVVPKPSRAAYPWTAAGPLRLGFLVYLAALVASASTFRKATLSFVKNRYILGGALLGVSAVCLVIFLKGQETPLMAAPLSPIGTAKGIFPGRVVWVHNPKAAQWTGTGNHWDSAYNPQAEYDRMIPAGILSLTGAATEAEGWQKLFTSFNQGLGRGARGYQAGERIAIPERRPSQQRYPEDLHDAPAAGREGDALVHGRHLSNPNLNGVPPAQGWADAPFNGGHASSLFMSQDGCAEESVSLDFFYQHYAWEVDSANNEGTPGLAGSQKYIDAAARAGAGVSEHWNNNTDRKYSRNLDPAGRLGQPGPFGHRRGWNLNWINVLRF